MNANAIQPGLEYAFTLYPSRGRPLSHYKYVHRVRVLHVYKGLEREYYKKSATLVEAVYLNEDGTVNTSKHLITAPARSFISHWAEYASERAQYEEERRLENERREQARREREAAYERVREQRLAKDAELRRFVAERLEIPVEYVKLSYGSVQINKPHVERRIAELVEGNVETTERATDQKSVTSPETAF